MASIRPVTHLPLGCPRRIIHKYYMILPRLHAVSDDVYVVGGECFYYDVYCSAVWATSLLSYERCSGFSPRFSFKTPFTRYNRLNNRLHRVNRHSAGLTTDCVV